MKIETTTAQNILAGMIKDIYLNVENPSLKIKKQYSKAVIAIEQARLVIEILNDYKEQSE